MEVQVELEALQLIGDYVTLRDGDNAISLKHTPKETRLLTLLDSRNISLNAVEDELSDKIPRIARKLKRHYDGVANEDKEFILFWQQSKTFSHAVEQLPSDLERKFFEGLENYFKRVSLEERITLDNQLEHFRIFYDNYPDHFKKTPSPEELKKKMSNVTCAMGKGAAVFMPVYVFSFGQAPLLLDNPLSGIGSILYQLFMYSLALGGPLAVDKDQRLRQSHIMKGSYHRPMQRKAKYADKLIPMIQKYAR